MGPYCERESFQVVELPDDLLVNGAASRHSVPVVAIVGRPNVGKSTLANRLAGRREAVVAEMPGVTRDRKTMECEWQGRHFELLDTGGWEAAPEGSLGEQVCRQAELAMSTADLVVLVMDATVGITDEDAQVAERLRRGSRPVLIAANKVDNPNRESDAAEFYSLGVGPVFPVSALHGHGSGDLLDAIVEQLEEEGTLGDIPGDDDIPAIALIGRPNAGKSTLFNALVGEERSIVHETAGTTRDAIDTVVELGDGRRYRFVDTAGMRRRAKISDSIEYYGGLRAQEAMDRADVALLVIDATGGVSQQDQRLAERAVSGGCGIVVVLTKWDLLNDEAKIEAEESVEDRLRFVAFAPLVRVSGLTGRGLSKILDRVDDVLKAYGQRVTTHRLNEVLSRAGERHPAPADNKGKRPRVLYGTQAASRPPTFVIFATKRFDPSYLNYIERRIREELSVGPTPIKIRVKTRADSGR